MPSRDNTSKTESDMQRRLLAFKKVNKINEIDYEIIRSSGSYRPRLYSLPIVHKIEVHLRPLLFVFNSPQHKLAKWCVKVLKRLEVYHSKHGNGSE